MSLFLRTYVLFPAAVRQYISKAAEKMCAAKITTSILPVTLFVLFPATRRLSTEIVSRKVSGRSLRQQAEAFPVGYSVGTAQVSLVSPPYFKIRKGYEKEVRITPLFPPDINEEPQQEN